MSSNQQIPPWLQEQIAKLQQTQQNLQTILSQKQQLELDRLETEKALEEIKKAKDDESVFKQAGTILIKSYKIDLTAELEVKIELSITYNEEHTFIILFKRHSRACMLFGHPIHSGNVKALPQHCCLNHQTLFL